MSSCLFDHYDIDRDMRNQLIFYELSEVHLQYGLKNKMCVLGAGESTQSRNCQYGI